ncbi:hypothetical protein CcCBS67573_g00334 [Chytriomyces confervae]|uniref:Autophagy-related protein 13 n=1 Tax=Chytriomyces confervae TaxID=246404 RepID=A0A507FSP9_9FUNG|nr:autophagy protein 13 [Chytriomyces hyalinus]TPX78455.1 hypothetical protein CcCBS67573_g00334 [Chytriomyces confervae]
MDASASSSAGSSNRNQANVNANASLSTDEQILAHFYGKFVQCVVQARCGTSSENDAKQRPNRWFNLDVPEVEPTRSEVKFWKRLITMQQSQSLDQMQPLILDVYLDLADTSIHPNNNNPQRSFLVIKDGKTMRKQRVNPDLLVGVSIDPITGAEFGVRKKRILLESWQLTLLSPAPANPPDISVMYKNMIMFFRSLFLYTRLLPAYKLCKRYSKPDGMATPPSKLKLGYRLASSRVMPVDEAGLDQLHLRDAHLGIAEYNFGALETTLGKLNVHVMYRVECDFTLSEPETVLNRSNFSAAAELDENFYTRSTDSNSAHNNANNQSVSSNNSIKQKNETLYQTPYIAPGSFSNSNLNTRRVSAPPAHSAASSLRSNSGGFFPSSSPSSRVPGQQLIGTSPRSLGAPAMTGSRANILNHHPMARAVGPNPSTASGASSFGRSTGLHAGAGGSVGGVSPGLNISGSFPKSLRGIPTGSGAGGSNAGAGLADAIAMGLFDGAQGLPFSIGRRPDGFEADRKTSDDVFLGLEESPPFDLFMHRDMSKYPRSGTSMSSNHSVGSNTTSSRRNSINVLPRRTGGIPFTTTILEPKPDDMSSQPSSLNSATGTLLASRGSSLPIIPGSTPPRAPFVSSIIFTTPSFTSNASFPGGRSPVPGVSSTQNPPPIVSMTRRAPNRRVLGVSPGAKTSEQLQQQVASITHELGDFIRGVEGKRKSLVLRHRQSAPGYLNKMGSGVDGSESSSVRRSSKNSLVKFAQLKDSYQEFSNSLVAATSSPKPIPHRSSTPPPVVFSNSPPTTSSRFGSSPKGAYFQPSAEAGSPSGKQRFVTSSLGRSPPGAAAAQGSYRSEKPQLRKPSSLQFATTVLSTVLSESGNGDDSSSGSNPVTSAQLPATSPIVEESNALLISRDRTPKKPPPASGVIPSVIPPAEPLWSRGGKPVHVYSADPARVSSGFFPVSDVCKTGGVEVEQSELGSKDRSASPAFPIKPLDVHLLGNQSTASSSLSTSLRTQGGIVPATAPVKIPDYSCDASGSARVYEPLSRRNSSGGLLSKVNSPFATAAATVGVAISSEGAGVVGKNPGVNTSRFGSAPVEVPFGRRTFSDRNRGDREDSWNIGEDDGDI